MSSEDTASSFHERDARALRMTAAIIVLSVAAIAALGYWDADREFDLALADFTEAQEQTANLLAGEIEARLAVSEVNAELPPIRELFDRDGAIGGDRAVVVLRLPRDAALRTRDGRALRSSALEAAMSSGASSLSLGPEESAELGLPPRSSIAGIRHVDSEAFGRFDIAVVECASRAKDRGYRGRNRILLAVLAAGGSVLVFGGIALRRQKKALELSKQLAIANLRRQLDERLGHLDKAATLGTLAMGVAHELSTPLTVISGRAEQLVARLGPDDRAREAAQIIIDQTTRISETIRAMMSLARGDRITAQVLSPERVIENVRGLIEHRFSKAGVGVRFTIAAKLPDVVGDPRLLEHALVNVLLNACEACEHGGRVEVTVSEMRGAVSFEIVDDGAGISDEARERATEPFFTTKSARGGSGIGLAIVNEIVAHHRGRFMIRASQAKGTAVRVEIPSAQGVGG